VEAYRSDGSGGWDYVDDASTAADGTYDLGGLDTGNYRVVFYGGAGDYAREWYNDKPDRAHADDVAVTAGKTTSGIDAALAAAGHITGTVTGGGGEPLRMSVEAYQSDGSGGWDYVDGTSTAADGTYDLGGLNTGNYRLRFYRDDGDDADYLEEYYNDKPTLDAADDVPVIAGKTTSGIDATLVLPPPTVTGFTPTTGQVGAAVTLTGTYFTDATKVSFNGTDQTALSVVSPTQITTTVPTGATTGTITVTTPGGSGTSLASFTVTTPLPLPTVTGFTPPSGPAGTTVTLTGTHFTGTTAVAFSGTAASFTVNSATQITATVPAGATTGKVTVTTSGGTATSATDFTVTAPTIMPKLTLKLTGLKSGSIKLGKSVTAKGAATPTSLAGSMVTLTAQLKKGTRWVKAKSFSALVDSTGAYGWKYKPAKRGAYRIQCSIAMTATHAAAATKWLAFKVK
jgi:hypothetical protein